MNSHASPKRLYRSRTDKRVAGILGGFAAYFHLDATWFRLAFVIIFLFLMAVSGFFLAFFLGALFYGVAWYVIPLSPLATTPASSAETGQRHD